ncbi:MAG: glycoside hydrolase family 3 C-terminal domain-containing protein [Bifidobacteriaceae bacterium]|jgi:hypothetical protein|nr:glycoside hydrolase family 3 C-terminal domain-containing protein [Bifidobacteriaceae bacterium]
MWTLKAGTDIDCQDDDYNTHIEAGYVAGLVSESDIDSELVRMYTTRMMFGEFDPAGIVPYAGPDYTVDNQRRAPDHQATALQMSEEAPVLLKNEPIGGMTATSQGRRGLPLTSSDAEDVVIVGYTANTFTAGGYSGSQPVDQRNIRQGIEQVAKQVNPNASVTYLGGLTPTNTGKPGVWDIQFRSSSDPGTPLKSPIVAGIQGMPKHLVDPVPIDSVSHWEGWMGISWTGQGGSLGRASQVWKGYFTTYVDVPTGTDALCLRFNGAGAPGATFDVYDGAPTGTPIARIPYNVSNSGQNTGSSCRTDGSTNVPVNITPGVHTLTYVYNPGTLGAYGTAGQSGTPYAYNLDPAQEQQIRDASTVIVVLGTNTSESGEEGDRVTIDFPKFQDIMAARVAALNPHTVVYMQTVGQMNIEAFRTLTNVPSIIWSTYNGQSQGIAAGNLLFGKANPSGKLSFTWYKNESDLASIWDYQITPDATHKGRSYQYFTGAASYPFGYGLSYSTFSYSNLRLDKTSVAGDDTLTATVDVTNSSAVPGKEAVQLYVSPPLRTDGVDRPRRELRGFEKVSLGAFETRSVPITIKVKDLWFWDDEAEAATWDLGTWELRMGGSSMWGLTTNFSLTAPPEPELATVITVPDGLVLNLDTPDNVIHAELSASRFDQTFYDLDDPSIDVSYSSKDPAIASVDAHGIVRAVGPGVTTITATVTADGASKSDDFAVVVKGEPHGNPSVNFPEHVIEIGDAPVDLQLTSQALGFPQGAEIDATYLLTGIHAENTAGASITPEGNLTVTRPGVVMVNVIWKNRIQEEIDDPNSDSNPRPKIPGWTEQSAATENAVITVIPTQPDPVAQIAVSPPPASGIYTAPPEVTVSAIVGSYSKAPLIEVSIDGGAWAAYAGALTVASDGAHTVAARVTDDLGNVSVEATANINIDTTAPDSATAVGAVGAEGVLTLSPVSGDVGSIEYSPDGVHWFTYTGPLTITGSVFYRGIDAAGNVGDLAFISVPGPTPIATTPDITVTPPDVTVNPTPVEVKPPDVQLDVKPTDVTVKAPDVTVKAPDVTVNPAPVTVTQAPAAPQEPRAEVVAPQIPKVAGVTPKIKGTVKVGKKLTAVNGTWTSGTTFTYRWYANGKAIKGATKGTLKLTKSLVGKKITVRVTGWKSGYTMDSAVSKATKTVKRK